MSRMIAFYDCGAVVTSAWTAYDQHDPGDTVEVAYVWGTGTVAGAGRVTLNVTMKEFIRRVSGPDPVVDFGYRK